MSSPFVDHAEDILRKMDRVEPGDRLEILVQALQWEFEDGYSAALADVETGEIET